MELQPLVQRLRDLFFSGYRYNRSVSSWDFVDVCDQELARLQSSGGGTQRAGSSSSGSSASSGSGLAGPFPASACPTQVTHMLVMPAYACSSQRAWCILGCLCWRSEPCTGCAHVPLLRNLSILALLCGVQVCNMRNAASARLGAGLGAAVARGSGWQGCRVAGLVPHYSLPQSQRVRGCAGLLPQAPKGWLLPGRSNKHVTGSARVCVGKAMLR